ncbi:MAG: DNA replication and repair protein RecF [Gammaproteobacteria bacterium]|jgi:DNA replication and repair protein RecF|nr:DNA replication and repair protein RecF [Gammaproteobacteria bacterium]|tara:strand:- start:128 stop:1213 length:1086 start_codon:yes stop_codon:yes gene_type:complete
MAIIEKIHILQFRNIKDQYIKPNKDINVFIGDNAQGKTNLIEAIYFLGHNKSFKTKNLTDLTPTNKKNIIINADVDGSRIGLERSKKNNSTTINKQKINNNSALTQLLPTQIISPDRGFIVGGAPKLKRSYLDWGVFHVEPTMLQTYKSFSRALKNINSLFSGDNNRQLDYWFIEFAKLSVKISLARKNYIERLGNKIGQSFLFKNNKPFDLNKTPSFLFSAGWTKDLNYLDQKEIYSFLKKNTSSFAKAKHVNHGPHKATIDFFLDGQTESHFSRGEQKTFSIMFWVAQVLILIDAGVFPVVLIDDMSSELDKEKTNLILDCLLGLGVQVFLTDIGKTPLKVAKKKTSIYKINSGVISGF